ASHGGTASSDSPDAVYTFRGWSGHAGAVRVSSCGVTKQGSTMSHPASAAAEPIAGGYTGMSARAAWKQRVAAYYAQSHRVRSAVGVSDQERWEPLSPFFKADPRRTDDSEVTRLAHEVTPATTLLDVGGGAGRLALPLAVRCRHVTVVEPSPSMGETL